jgi:hypothetical protein
VDAVETLNQLIYIIDDRELYAAIVELLKAEGRAPNLVPPPILCGLFRKY